MKGLISRIALVAVVVLTMAIGSVMADSLPYLEGRIALTGMAELHKYDDDYATTGGTTRVTNFHEADMVVFIRATTSVTGPVDNSGATEPMGDYRNVGVSYSGTPVEAVGIFRDQNHDMCTEANLPIYSLGAGDGFSFFMLTIDETETPVTDKSNGLQSLWLTGSALAMAPGYENTIGYWTFGLSKEMPYETQYSWQGSFSSAPPPVVPEPTTMLLLGTGLLGIAALARRNSKK